MDMPLTSLIKQYPNALSSDFCQSFIDIFEANSALHNLNGGGKHEHLGSESRWLELNIGPLLPPEQSQFLAQQMAIYKDKYEQDCGMPEPLPTAASIYPFRMKKYLEGEHRFIPHMDAYGPMSNRFLVYLWYFNDVAEGGETEFVDLGVAVKPQQGTLVMFPPYWMYRHEAKPPISNPKYVINTFYNW